MLAKYWKKILLLVLIIACLFNIISKLVKKIPYEQELKSTVDYVKPVEENNKN